MALHGENRAFPAYTQLRQIPGGANGLIHLARHTGYDLPCVQKSYPRQGRGDALAFNEPRLLRELKHPHIVEILDAQPDGDRRDHVTMVMPSYPGGDLRLRISRGEPLSVGQVIEWTSQVASALDYLHTEKGYLHRDIKPGNLLIDDAGRLLVCDFGTAAATSVTGHTAPVRATPPYQPPEAARDGWLHEKSDIYSLGLTAIEMLDGRFLYEGLDSAVVQARVDSGRRAYPDARLATSARPPHAPRGLRSLLGRCVAKDPNDRPSAAELVTALQALRTVDWKHVRGVGLDGEWMGTWPPRARPDKAVRLRISSGVASRGKQRGLRALKADYRKPGNTGWRTVGSRTSPAMVDPHDAAAVSKFFKTVADITAHRFPS